jgi:hypothetical protein
MLYSAMDEDRSPLTWANVDLYKVARLIQIPRLGRQLSNQQPSHLGVSSLIGAEEAQRGKRCGLRVKLKSDPVLPGPSKVQTSGSRLLISDQGDTMHTSGTKCSTNDMTHSYGITQTRRVLR